MRLIRKRATERGSYLDRFRGLIFNGFLSTKRAGPPPKPPLMLELERGKVVWVCHDESVDLECRSGVLWITRGDQRDLILTSGESLIVQNDQRVLHPDASALAGPMTGPGGNADVACGQEAEAARAASY